MFQTPCGQMHADPYFRDGFFFFTGFPLLLACQFSVKQGLLIAQDASLPLPKSGCL